MSSALLSNANIITMDPSRRVLSQGAILIQDNQILRVGKSDELFALTPPDAEHIDMGGRWVLPGLINTHVHLSQQLGRGLADDVDLLTWLRDRIWPYESNLTEEDNYVSSLLCGLELIRSGVTCFAEAGGPHVDGMGRAVSDLGLRAILTQSTMDMGDGLPPAWVKTTEESLAIQLRHYEKWHKQAQGRIQVWFGLRTIFNNSDALILRSKQLADSHNVGIHMHVAEVPQEIEFTRRTRGASTVAHLNQLGVLDHNFLAVHCVWLEEDEISMFADRGVKVSHCPAAALKVLGTARIPEMQQAGICVTLGTDGAPANNRMTIIDEMWLASLIHKGRLLDPTVMPAQAVLEMVTCDGAQALMLDACIGSLEPGKKADLVVINPDSATMLPLHDPVANMVSALRAENIESLMVDGRWIMSDRRILTVNETEILAEAKARAAAIAQRAGIYLPERFPMM